MLASFDQWRHELLAPFASLADFFDAGGPVLIVIFFTALIMWTLIIERYWYFKRMFPREQETLRAAWAARSERKSWYARRIRTQMISEARLAMSANLPIMRAIIPLCPLLGLMGTVVGMLEVFDVMSLKGRADAQTMASGVSQAMIATMAGLAVSLSGMYPIQMFEARARREAEQLNDVLVYE
ncbi:MAG: MotA/TolQ/ExbB proton channel family protein [Pseudomonadota bacterium]|nr:MotA/TolQ/ExbB proton channel family protein [Pseudomonadota bacterium]